MTICGYTLSEASQKAFDNFRDYHKLNQLMEALCKAIFKKLVEAKEVAVPGSPVPPMVTTLEWLFTEIVLPQRIYYFASRTGNPEVMDMIMHNYSEFF